MLKLQIFYIIKIMISLFVLIKNFIGYKYKNRKLKVERIEKIPIRIFFNNCKDKNGNKKFDQKYRRASYIRAFFYINKYSILYHFFFFKCIYLLFLFLKDLPKLIKILYKYMKNVVKSYSLSNIWYYIKTFSKSKTPFKQKSHRKNHGHQIILDKIIQFKKSLFLNYKKSGLKINKKNKVNKMFKHHNSHRFSSDADFVVGLVKRQSIDVSKNKKSIILLDFDTKYFLNMFKLLIFKLQFKYSVFYKTTNEILQQYFGFLFFDSSKLNFRSLWLEIVCIFRSVLRYSVISYLPLIQNRFIHMSFRWNFFGKFRQIIDQYLTTSFLYNDLNFNINHILFYLFYMRPNMYIQKTVYKKKDIGTRFVGRNNNLLFTKIFSQNINYFYYQEEDRYLERYNYFKFATDNEMHAPFRDALNFSKTDVINDNRKMHYKHVYGGHLLYDYFILPVQTALKFYYYVNLQVDNYLWFLSASLLDKVKYRSLGSKFGNIYYKVIHKNRGHPYNSILYQLYSNKFDKNQMLYTYKFINKFNVRFIGDLFNFQIYDTHKPKLIMDFFALKRNFSLNKFEITLFELIYILIRFFLGYIMCLYHLYQPQNAEINWNKWNLFYKFNKKIYVKHTEFSAIMKKNVDKILRFRSIFKYSNKAKWFISKKISIYRILFLFNKYLYIFPRFYKDIISDIKLYLNVFKRK